MRRFGPVRDLVLHAADRLGYQIVANWRMPGLQQARLLRQLFALLDIQCVLDVGANKGQYRDFLREEVGYARRIISFEPIAELARMLEERARRDSEWSVCPYALGSRRSELTLNVAVQSEFSSFHRPHATTPPRYAAQNAMSRLQAVSVHALDDVLGSLAGAGGNTRFFLKLDTQGYDVEVLQGARASLARIWGLQMEMSVIPLYEGAPDYLASLRYLQDLGFSLSGTFPVAYDEHMRVVEFDCIAINNQLKLRRDGDATN